MSFIAEILNALASRSTPGLISAEAFAHFKSLGRLLPDGITHGIGFESRLADPSKEVDFILRPSAPDGLAIIAGLDQDAACDESAAVNKGSPAIHSLIVRAIRSEFSAIELVFIKEICRFGNAASQTGSIHHDVSLLSETRAAISHSSKSSPDRDLSSGPRVLYRLIFELFF